MPKLSSILLVDDDYTTTFLHTHLLETLGVTDEVLVARNGQQALDVLVQHCTPPAATCPALVLLDINMPVMGGIDFLEAYQRQPPTVPIRVVILTSSVNPHDLKRLQQLPYIALLHKPLTRSKIKALLQEHF
jgi:CheY-like chemotaxis protein